MSVLWDRRQKLWAPPVALIGAAALVFTMFTSYQAAYERGGQNNELFVQAGQAAPDVPEWVDRMRQLNRLSNSTWGTDIRVAIDDDVYWPYGFYLRDDAYATFATYSNTSETPPDADVIIVSGFDLAQLEQQLVDLGQSYQRLDYTHRWWWVPDYTSPGVGGWLQWVWNREIWDKDQPVEGQAGNGALTGAVLIRTELLQLETDYNAAALPG